MRVLKRNTFLVTTAITVICLAGGVFLSLPSTATAQNDPIANTINSQVPFNPLQPLNGDLTPPDTGKNVCPECELGFDYLAQVVYNALTSIGSWITYMGGFLLDTSLSWFVWDMRGTTNYLYLDQVISTVWAMIRDLFNLLFIFGLVLVGFKLILGIDDSGSKRTLGTIVIAALLINFSLYAAQVVVDLGNILAVEVSKQIHTSQYDVMGRPVFNVADSFVKATSLDNISGATLSGISELSTNVIDVPTTKINVGKALVIGLTIAGMLIILGFVFAAGAFLMFLRYFYLLFLMMFSPIMVLGWVLPQFKSQTSKWWSTLIKQALLGPAYLMMIYISLLALQALSLRAFNGNQSITTFIMMSLIVSAFAWASLIVAKQIGALGASGAMSLGQSWGRSIRGGITGYAGRNTIGRFGDWYNKRLEERGVSDKSLRRGLASSLAGNKFGSSYSRTSARESQEKAAQKRARFEQIYGGKKLGPDGKPETPGITSAITAGIAAQQKAREERTEEDKDAISRMERAVTGAQNEHVVELLGHYKEGGNEFNALVANMSAGQFDAAMKAKSEELDDGIKAKIAAARKVAVEKVLTEGALAKEREKDPNTTLTQESALQKGIRDADDHQLKVMGVKALSDNATYLKQSQLDDIMKSKDYTPSEKSRIKEARDKGLRERFNNDSERKEIFKGLQDKEIASLPKDILIDGEGRSVEFITGGALRKIAEDDKLAESDRETLKYLIKITASAKESAKAYLKSPQGQERYGEWKE